MLRKNFFVLSVLSVFTVSAVAFAQQSSSGGQGTFQPGPGSPWYKPTSGQATGQGGFQQPPSFPANRPQLAGQGTSATQVNPVGNFPGRPGAAPEGQQWTPGHYEQKNGKQKWVPGGYRPVNESASTPTPITPPWFVPAGQKGGGINPAQAKEAVSPSGGE